VTNNFWQKLARPILGLSPMDGITDPAFRAVVDQIGNPTVLFTEFIPAEGLLRAPNKFVNQLITHQTKTPIVVQLFGNQPASFQQAAILVTKMNRFAGIDINLGCPAKNLAQKGMGGGLIKNPLLAKEIITATIKATPLPVSVKTRIGFDKIITKEWIGHLLETKPAALSLHGRTLKQLYTGKANWEEIGLAAQLAKQAKTVFLGNGDIQSRSDALEKINQYQLDGVLIGRAALGNPWVFKGQAASYKLKLQTALLQCQKFTELTPTANFLNIRKHLLWYCRGFSQAQLIRSQLMNCVNYAEVRSILEPLINS
jgi:nifR3 family TIM-barrel protein